MAGRTKPATAKPGAALVMGAALAEVLGLLKFQEARIRALEFQVRVLTGLAGLPERAITGPVADAVRDLTAIQGSNDATRAGTAAPTTEKTQ